MKREPAIIIGALEALAIAVVALVAYLLSWDAETTALVLGVVGAAIAFVGAVVGVRPRVTPV